MQRIEIIETGFFDMDEIDQRQFLSKLVDAVKKDKESFDDARKLLEGAEQRKVFDGIRYSNNAYENIKNKKAIL